MARWLKVAGITAGVLLGLIVLAVIVVYVSTQRRMHRRYVVPVAELQIERDSATLAWGRHIVETRGCNDCHGANLAGGVVIDEPVIARIWAPNLTAGEGGVGRDFTPADWDRAIRHGVAKDGRPLMIMPSAEYNLLSDEDVSALIAYLETVPAVDQTVPTPKTGPLGRLLFFAGRIPLLGAEVIDHSITSRKAPPVGPTAEYGRYLAVGCGGCHSENFAGGPIPGMPPGTPPAANITPDSATGIGRWSEADFVRALREGKRPDGTALSDVMPWRVTARMTDDELRALYAYLRTVPAQALAAR